MAANLYQLLLIYTKMVCCHSVSWCLALEQWSIKLKHLPHL